MIRFVSVALCVASLVGCASNSTQNDSSNESSAASTTSTSGTLAVPGKDGGTIFFSKQSMLDTFRALAVKTGSLSPEYDCVNTDQCMYDPTVIEATPGQTYLSDDYNRFVGPDGRRYEWTYLANENAYIFVDRDANTTMAALLDAYNTDVIYNKDTSDKASELLAPIQAWFDAHTAADTTNAGRVIAGSHGGMMFFRKQEMLDTFRAIAVANPASGICKTVDSCAWDPTDGRPAFDETWLSDNMNRFTAPDGRNFEWAYLADVNVYMFVDRDANADTAALLDPYLQDVIYNKDTTDNAWTFYAPVKAWFLENVK